MNKYSIKLLLKNQAGMSLIELMIAMVIGLFLLAGIASSYVSSKNSSVKRDQVSLLEDNGRLVLELISKTVEHTGYTPVNSSLLPAQFIVNASDVVSNTCTDGSQNVVNTGIFSVTADHANGDSLGVIYHTDNEVQTDCLGISLPPSCSLKPLPNINPNPESSSIYNSFFVDASDHTLKCASSRANVASTIAEGVENIQFLYGVDTVGNDGLVDRYLNASSIGASQWNNVVSIQIAVLVRSLKKVKNIAESKQFTLLDTVVTRNDRYQHAVFTTTVRLRNTL